MEPETTLFSGTRLRAAGTGLDRARILVTFDRRRKGRTGFTDYVPARRALRRGFGHLSIDVARNDWFVNAETAALRRHLRDYTQGRLVQAIGFSMGGYGAILFAGDLRIDSMLLVAPQYSIFDHRAPFDARCRTYAPEVDPQFDDYAPPADGGPRGLVIYDPRTQPVDRLHADLICHDFPRLRRAALPFGGHPPLNHFETVPGYSRMLDAFLDDDLSPALVRNLHREARETSDRYARFVTKYIRRRAGR
ncbi:alpha/beta hydrolase [Ruixingdingia sedimenti]|uniref:Alpha/beta hydrolase n=1 Tax=Ruixingdingia sedimenti TaxID=3073604 RepID=A0ABU1F9Y3_9RHOB|nr:alpha/beta hydrolase [Xinfangfangia sp. LG-4]MDR5653669.1 alpha/beta hydrolase [Xinfangfangia sp. LG-4]